MPGTKSGVKRDWVGKPFFTDAGMPLVDRSSSPANTDLHNVAVQTLKDAREMMLFRQATRAASDLQAEPAPPPPGIASLPGVGDAIAAVKAAADIHEGAARTALTQAEQAREEADALRQSAGASYSAGFEEGKGQMTEVLQIVQTMSDTVLKMTVAAHEREIGNIQAQHESILGSINDRLGLALGLKDAEIARVQAENERLRAVAAKPTIADKITSRVMEHIEAQIDAKGIPGLLGGGPVTPPAETPEERHRHLTLTWADEEHQLEMEARRRHMSAEDREADARIANHQKVGDAVEKGIELLGRAVGVSGSGGDFPSEPPAA